jgi:transposase
MLEAASIPDDIESLHALVRERDTTIDEYAREIAQLREYVRLLKTQRFGASSERVHREQLGLFNEAEQLLDEAGSEADEETVSVPAHTRAKRGRRPLPTWMEQVEVLHDLPEDEKICSADGTALVEIGRETSQQLELIPATARVLVHVRPKYGCPCCKTGVSIAPMPPQPIPKSWASPSLLAFVAVSKYADALPLYRQEGILARIGVDLSRATLAFWMVRCGELVQPLINLMRERLLEHDFIQCDETPFQVLKEPGKSAESDAYLWVQRGTPEDHSIILYEYDPSRSGEVAERLFEGFQGIAQTDGYSGYGCLDDTAGVVHVGCFAHARRKFMDALKGAGKNRKKNATPGAKQSVAETGLRFIETLYKIERSVAEASVEERLRVRKEKSVPIALKLRAWLDTSIPMVPPKSLTGIALGYLDKQWKKLVRIFDYGHVPLDTNLVENSIRPFAVGRRNWLFADTVRGAKASANLYSLIETAKANAIEPWAYLERVFRDLPAAITIEDVEALLPSRVRARKDAVR